MKFEKLILEKYGHYEGRDISFRADADLHIVLGRNEAGKSTALKAISDLLFGFDRRTNDGVFKPHFRFEMRDLRIGGQLRIANGDLLAFRRKRGNKNTLTDASGAPLADDTLDAVLGGLDRDAFEKEYGLTSDSLRAGGYNLLTADGDLAETLAAGSAGLSALNRLKTQLQAGADEIFAIRKSEAKPFYKALDSYDKAKRGLHEAVVTKEAVGQAEKERVRQADIQRGLQDEHRAISRDLSKLKRAKQVRPLLARIAGLEERIGHCADLPQTSSEQLECWKKAFEDEREAAEKIDAAQEKRKGVIEAIAALAQDQALVEAAPKVKDLREQLGAVNKTRADLPNRKKELQDVELRLDQAARDLGLESRDRLLAVIPASPVLARVNAFIRRRHDAAIRRQGLDENLKIQRRQQAELQRGDEAQGHIVDPAHFAAELERFAEIPRDSADLRRLSAELEQAVSNLDDRAARLQPSAPPLDALGRLALPEAGVIEAARRNQDERLQRQRTAKENLANATADVASTQRKLANLAGEGAVATRVDLVSARAERDAALKALQASYAGEARAREAALAALREASLRLDMVTDSLLDDADRAAAKLALEQRLEEARENEQAAREAQANLLDESKAALETWRRLWEPFGFEPGTPDAMRNWLSQVQDILEQKARLSANRARIAELGSRIDGRKPALLDLFVRLGGCNAGGLPAEDIYADAQRILSNIQKQWNERRDHAVLLKRAGEEIDRIGAEIAALDEEAVAESTLWAAAMTDIGRSANAGVAEAEQALEIWQRAISGRKECEDITHRVEAMRRDIEMFEAGLAEFCARVAADLGRLEPGAALAAIEQRLQQSRQADEDRVRLDKEIAGLDHALAALEAARTGRREVLAEAAMTLGVSAEAVGLALVRLEERHRVENDLASQRADLAHLADNLSIESLRAELAGLDPDSIDGELNQLEQRGQQLLGEMNEAAVALRDAERALEALLEGRNAAALAQEREQAAGELLDISRRWLVRAAAARLAGQAIERHRRQAQGPAMARASALFAHATAGAFERLAPDYDDNDKLVFKAIRMGGEPVDVSGLSDGTRDQLFLALRLAMLEQRRGEPLPFIGDDLLTSFDETRTAQAIDILAEFGKERQAILFSHHRHVAEIARDKLGSKLDLIEL